MGFVSLAIKGMPKLISTGAKVLVPLGIGTVGIITTTTKGLIDFHSGKTVRKTAIKKFEIALVDLEQVELKTERVAREYGEHQIAVHKASLGRFADWLEQNQAQVKRLHLKKVDGVSIKIPEIPKYVANVQDVMTGASGLASAVGVGVSAPAAALWGVSTFATAGTGAAISGLNGVAATNATLAALGGGTLAAGGGGMAAGAAVLGLTATVPAFLIGGFTVSMLGARTKTKSQEFAAQVTLEIERALRAKDLLSKAQDRILELQDILDCMAKRTSVALDRLESVKFDAELHAHDFLSAFQLVTAVKEILNAPVLDPETGDLSELSIEIIKKYTS